MAYTEKQQAYFKEYYKTNKKAIGAKVEEWKKNNPDKAKVMRKRYKVKKKLLRDQAATRPMPERCEVCETKAALVWDHDHSTGKFRGWLCSHCNTGLGLLKDNIDVLYSMISYLEFSRYDLG